jgi:peptidylprolyl isomerase
VEKGQLLVASYVGQIWRGKVFDSSFSRHQLAAFPIGLGHVIPGWDKTLVGVRAGSRMLLVIPPVDGYGAAGDAKVGITGTDTLVFVVDVVASYSKTVTGDLNAAVLTSDVGEIAVTGALGQPPNIHIAGTALPPAKSIATVIAKGIGPPVKPGLVVLQYVVVDWTTNSIVQSTWKNGLPDGEVVGEAATPNVLDTLVGIPIGSRVLVQIPKVSSGGPYALAVDIVAEPTSA